MKPKTVYFKTAQQAHDAMQPWIDKEYFDRFQDARSIGRIKIVEYTKGFAIQIGDSGPYLTNEDIKEATP